MAQKIRVHKIRLDKQDALPREQMGIDKDDFNHLVHGQITDLHRLRYPEENLCHTLRNRLRIAVFMTPQLGAARGSVGGEQEREPLSERVRRAADFTSP